MRSKIGTLTTFSILILLLSGCDFINPAEQVPSYIQIDSISLNHEKSLGITDAWVYVNTQLIGVYELPAKIPILTEGISDIMISAGIKVNGISATRTFYPFYTSYRANKELKSMEIIKINPTLGYLADNTDILWQDNFEGTGIKFEHNSSIKYGFVKSTELPIQGKYSGLIQMDSSTHLFSEISIDEIIKPDNITQGYFMELNFKTDIIFCVVLKMSNGDNNPPNILVYFNPTNGKWKKIYIDLYNPLSKYPAGTKFKVVITNYDYYLKTALNQPLVINPKTFIDDIKIVN